MCAELSGDVWRRPRESGQGHGVALSSLIQLMGKLFLSLSWLHFSQLDCILDGRQDNQDGAQERWSLELIF